MLLLPFPSTPPWALPSCRLLVLGWHHALLPVCLSPSALGAQRPVRQC